LHAFEVEPLQVQFPFARTLIVLRSERTIKKTALSTTESRFYLSSVPAQQHGPERWLQLIRGHWGGVEIRNHWRRDVLMGEDASRSRNANLLANMALIRSALLEILSEHIQEQSLPQFQENIASDPKSCLALLSNS
jgi:predicted transposase YbfD/YdcC